jgi:cyclopropane-fatty-acyl-phospholipid synthase
MKTKNKRSGSEMAKSTMRPSFWRQLIMMAFSKITVGRLTLYEADELLLDVGSAPSSEAVIVNIKSASAYQTIALGGSLGAAEAYMDGLWDCGDLLAVQMLFLKNRQVLRTLDGRWSMLKKPLVRIQHWLNRDTVAQSKRNIAAHYDLGDSFFEQFLDDTMMYSSGYFRASHQSMRTASEQKMDLICQKMKLRPSDHILEIGAGWGGFACFAARNYGCRVTTTTISEAQYKKAQKRVAAEKLQDRVILLKSDYRNLEGQFDKIVSIEMIEAVGLAYLPQFFQTCAGLLKPGGSMLIQAITIAEEQFDSAKRSVDFIQRYIFPGGALASVKELVDVSASRQAGFRLYALEDLTPHYALTLAKWREAFEGNLVQIRLLGLSETFLRMWQYYLCYCEAGFNQRVIGCVHMQLHLPAFKLEVAAHD